jgi:hypothetical protein
MTLLVDPFLAVGRFFSPRERGFSRTAKAFGRVPSSSRPIVVPVVRGNLQPKVRVGRCRIARITRMGAQTGARDAMVFSIGRGMAAPSEPHAVAQFRVGGQRDLRERLVAVMRLCRDVCSRHRVAEAELRGAAGVIAFGVIMLVCHRVFASCFAILAKHRKTRPSRRAGRARTRGILKRRLAEAPDGADEPLDSIVGDIGSPPLRACLRGGDVRCLADVVVSEREESSPDPRVMALGTVCSKSGT